MAGIYGMLNMTDADVVYVNTIGQELVYEAVQTYVARVNADLAAQKQLFVELTTETYKERYKLPGGGRLQRRGGFAQSGATKASGQWDVAYPLEEFGDQKAWTDVDMAYMTVQEVNRQMLDTVIKDTNTVRALIFKPLFDNTERTFKDENWGDLLLEPLANGDSVLYPPVAGSETEATDNHYLVSLYTVANISETNNPIITIVNKLEEDFGSMTGGENIVTFHTPAVVAKLRTLADFVDVTDAFIRVGANTDVPVRLPNVPGRIVGRAYGAWIVEYRWMPTAPNDYSMGIHADAPPPLKERVDPGYTRLKSGLQLIARDARYPIQTAHWRHRVGYGVGNRQNGVIMQYKASGSYDIPTPYA